MQVRGVQVLLEQVPSIPHGAKMLIDEPPGEAAVIWVRDKLDDRSRKQVVRECATHFDWLPLTQWLESALNPS